LHLIYCIHLQEWGSSCPHQFLGGYRLEADMSWTAESKVHQKDRELSVINHILTGTKTLAAAIDFSGEHSGSLSDQKQITNSGGVD